MATPSTINSWTDELSASIIRDNGQPPRVSRKRQDDFRKRVKRHNFARTNQFEVENRLDGLEEKFQILTLDNLSDALRQRRSELKEFQFTWLPDVLDLFLHLSGDPARNENLLELYRVPARVGTPPPLKWKDLQDGNPIDKHDRLWRVPDFRDTDDSGYEDDMSFGSSAKSTPEKQRRTKHEESSFVRGDLLYSQELTTTELDIIKAQQQHLDEISEEYFLREALSFLCGYTSRLLTRKGNIYELATAVSVRGIAPSTLNSAVQQIAQIRSSADLLQTWIREPSSESYVCAMKDVVEGNLRIFHTAINELSQQFTKNDETVLVSIIGLLHRVETDGCILRTVAAFLDEVKGADSIELLEMLYSRAHISQLSDDLDTFKILRQILAAGLRHYLLPVCTWMLHGELGHSQHRFFIHENTGSDALQNIWRGRYSLDLTRKARAPDFISETLQNILACGKTSLFLQRLSGSGTVVLGNASADLSTILESMANDTAAPMTATFESAWVEYVTTLLQSRTSELKRILDERCGFEQIFDAIARIYLCQDSALLDDMETKVFDRIDLCADSWNDRFQVRDMLEEVFAQQGLRTIADAITIHSVFTSSRTMQSRRTSVSILRSLSLEYRLSWPIANIVDLDSMIAYRRVALRLTQIRRSKHCLERTGYAAATTVPLGEDASLTDQKFAQLLIFTLLGFVNTLYHHLTSSTISPLTNKMRIDMEKAATVDEMIEIHKTYITRMEYSCLAARKLKVLRQSLVTILDLCIRTSDLVSNPSKAQDEGNSDIEVSSFISAQSGNKALRADQYGSDSDDDEFGQLGGGYSSFIVLEEDTTIVKELKKIKTQYEKQSKFLVAGLRGVSKSGSHAQDLEGLADRLSWVDLS